MDGVSFQERVDTYTSLAEQSLEYGFGTERSKWMDRLGQAHSDIQVVLAQLLDQEDAAQGLQLTFLLQELWFEEQHTAEGRAWFERFLALPQTNVDDVLRSQSLDLAGALALAQEDYVTAHALKEQGIAVARDLGNDQRLGYGLIHLAHLVGYCEGDYHAARRLYQEGFSLSQRIGDQEGMAHAQANLANVAAELGEYQTARPLVCEGIRAYRQLSDWNQAHFLLTAAAVAAGLSMAEPAVCLAGASMVHQEAIDLSQPRAYRERDQRMLQRALHALDQSDRDAAWQSGQEMSLDQATAFALEVLDSR